MNLKTFFFDPKLKQYRFDPAAFHVKPCFLVPNEPSVNATHPEQVQMGGSAASPQVVISSREEGLIEIKQLSMQKTAACLVEIIDEAKKHKVTGQPCHVDTVMGTGIEPFLLSESVAVLRNEALVFRATDLSGQSNDVRPVFAGERVRAVRANDARLDKYVRNRLIRARYVAGYLCPLDDTPSAMTQNQENEYTYTQDERGHFEVFKLTYSSTGAFKFKIRDELGEELTNSWLYSTAVLGTAVEPYILPRPWTIKAGGVVTFTIKSLHASANTIYLTLCGRMIFV